MTSADANPFTAVLTREQRAWILFVVMSLGFMARMLTVHAPLFDHHSWRQADGAMIARNFYRDGIAPFHPQTDARGSRADGYVASGLELHAIVFAAVARVAGFATEVGRTVSALCFPVSAVLLWGFMRLRYGDWHAVFAVSIYALGLPLALYAERAVWNEPLLLLLSLAALRAAQSWILQRRAVALASLLAAVALIAAVKPQWLIVLLPLIALWVERDGLRAFFRWEPWLVVAVAAAAAAAMMWQMRAVAALPGATDFGAADKLFNMEDMTGHYVYVVLRRLIRDTLGPIGVIAWLTGVVFAWRRGKLAEGAAFVAFLAYVIIVSRGVRVHDYYQLAVMPGALMALPEGVFRMAAAIAAAARSTIALPASRVALALVWMMWVFCFGRTISFHSWYEVDRDKQYVCSALRPALAPGDLVVFSNYGSPDLLYCLDRRGWLLTDADSTPERVAAVAREGAAVLVMPAPVRPDLAGDRQPFIATEHWTVYRLR